MHGRSPQRQAPAVEQESLVRIEPHGPQPERLAHPVELITLLRAQCDDDPVQVRVFSTLPQSGVAESQRDFARSDRKSGHRESPRCCDYCGPRGIFDASLHEHGL